MTAVPTATPTTLATLQQRRAEIVIDFNAAKACLAQIDQQIAEYCHQQLKQLYELQGKMGGTVTADIEGIKVKGEISKTVKWDTEKLRDVAREMAPERFNEIFQMKLSVPEKVYGTLDDETKSKIDIARTVQYGDIKATLGGSE